MSCAERAAEPVGQPDGTNPPTRLRLDRPHLPAAPSTASAGATTSSTAPSPTANDDAMVLRAGQQNAERAGHLEPAARLRRRQGTTASSATSRRSTSSCTAAKAGTLPACRWVVPNGKVSEHPPARVSDGQAYVTSLDQRGDAGPRLESAPRSSWPGTTGAASTTTSCRPTVDENGYGLRVPGLVISPYAKHGLHRPPDAQLRRLPQVHRGRLPGRPAPRSRDRRPARPAADVRENAPILGDLTADFDFTQAPAARGRAVDDPCYRLAVVERLRRGRRLRAVGRFDRPQQGFSFRAETGIKIWSEL